jgi:hypothetical protein
MVVGSALALFDATMLLAVCTVTQNGLIYLALAPDAQYALSPCLGVGKIVTA